MRAIELLKEESGNVWSVTLKDKWTDPGDPSEYREDVQNWEYDVRYNGKVVGSLTYDTFFGNMLGDFGARTIEIGRYADPSLNPIVDDDEQMEAYVLSSIGNYFNSKTGNRHFEVMTRQQGLEKEELEEIKVTKTLAGKRTRPTQDLASKEKMSRSKKYRDGSEKKDASTPMNRNVHDLANITLKGEYRS